MKTMSYKMSMSSHWKIVSLFFMFLLKGLIEGGIFPSLGAYFERLNMSRFGDDER